MRLIITYIRRYWIYASLAPLFMLTEVLLDLMQPTLMSRIIDIGIAQMDVTVVLRTGIIMIGAAALGLGGGAACGVTATIAAANMAADLRQDLYRKVLTLSHANIDALETGNIITRLTNDVVQVENMTRMMLRIMVRVPLQVIGSVIMAIVISPSLSMLLFILVPLIIALFVVIIRRAYPLFSEVQERLDGVNVRVQESLSAIRLIKSFNEHGFEKRRFGAANDAFMKQNIAASRVVALIHPSTQIIMYAGIAAVLWFGGIQVTESVLPIGRVLAFINYLTQLLFSLIMANNLLMQFSRAQASIRRIQEIRDAVPAIEDDTLAIAKSPASPGETAPRRLSGKIEFRNVDFGYDGRRVLRDVSFTIQPGEMVVILGETGSGKSSLVKLIPRLYDATAGSVLIDDIDVRSYDLDELRRSIGMAPQQVTLFSGSIAENITYGCRSVDATAAARAAETAAVSDFIDSLPDGLDTEIQQRGTNLSGGQKQRISIARAIAHEPAIRIFDDATSAVDLTTEVAILEALKAQTPRVTTVLVAQRVTTAMIADKVVVIDDGSITGIGTHETLLSENPLYREIYRSQFGDIDHE